MFSTSPFENAAVFTSDIPGVVNITLNPSESSISAGQSLQLTANVETNGFANKAVIYSITKNTGEKAGKVTVDQNGLVKIPSDYDKTQEAPQIEVTATSIYDNTKTAKATITVL